MLYKSLASPARTIKLGKDCEKRLQPFTVLKIEQESGLGGIGGVGVGGEVQQESSIDGAAVSTGGAVHSSSSSGDSNATSGASFVDLGTGVIAGIALVAMLLMFVVVAIVVRRCVNDSLQFLLLQGLYRTNHGSCTKLPLRPLFKALDPLPYTYWT